MEQRTGASRRHRRRAHPAVETRGAAAGPARADLANRPTTAPADDSPRRTRQPPRRRAGAAHDQAEFLRHLRAEHGESLTSYVLRLTAGDRNRAEGIVHETLLRAWHHTATSTQERGPVRAWLMRVAHNIAVDAYRAAKARPAEATHHGVPEAPAPNRRQSNAVITADDVEQALSRLSAEHRAVLTRIYVEGRTTAEAARTLGIPVGTATARTHYALRTLLVMFDECREQAV